MVLVKLLREIPPPLGKGFESGIDVIGDIAIVRYQPDQGMKELGETLLRLLGHVKAVYGQEGGIEGEFRLRRLRHLAGEKRTVTLHKENGCLFRVDVATCYFSPRLSTERLRIAERVRDGERVLNMFAGVGVYSITIAKRKAVRVESCELNAAAYGYHLWNNKLNKVTNAVHAFNEDAARLPGILGGKFDRILMPHPSQSHNYMPAALALAKSGTVIHYYRHISSENMTEARDVLANELGKILPQKHRATIRKVREVGKRFLELVADVTLD